MYATLACRFTWKSTRENSLFILAARETQEIARSLRTHGFGSCNITILIDATTIETMALLAIYEQRGFFLFFVEVLQNKIYPLQTFLSIKKM